MSKNYKKIIDAQANQIIVLLNNTAEENRDSVLESEIENFKNKIEFDLRKSIEDFSKYKLTK